ncbi:MAG: outer membrane beta-barrel protein [Methylotenera sp.]|nr:outer membrane beta-barrel protein [Methylotenera sp.]MDO9232785.1 outer membrane beta-barrel protein [Methylotenera sp.]MDO9389706.1 outer membrane beta-barrel protein [Methylotenera sp.]MDP2102033.1 outer membrane beta-barrel protein [Methylotenera sp.]MDP2281317.1 outer membrane beta-barrel protein [Methylotenera sp.]
MKKNLVSLAVATSLGLAAFSASAEDMYRGAWYAVPGVSYMNTDSDLDADNGRGGFLSIGKELSPSWDIQGRLGYNRADEDTNFAGIDGKYKQTTLGLDALYMFSRDKFRPFLLAGLGAARNNVDYDNPADGKKTSWLANVGLGAQYLFNDSFGLQADLRHQWSRAKLGFNNDTLGDNTTETVGNTLFNLGGVFRFGAPTAVPVIAAVEPEPAPYVAPAPEPVAEPAPAPVCVPEYETITIEASKLFDFDEAKLKDTSVLDNEVVPKMKGNRIFTSVKVTGHTDKFGSEAYNQKLSEKRANQVRDYLISQGIEADRLLAVGKGEMIPLVDCDGVKGRKALIECLAPNRRVEIEATRSMAKGCQ